MDKYGEPAYKRVETDSATGAGKDRVGSMLLDQAKLICAGCLRLMRQWFTWLGLFAVLFAIGPMDFIWPALRGDLTLDQAWRDAISNFEDAFDTPLFKVVLLLFGFAFFGIAALRVGREMREIEAKQAEGLRADAATRAASLEASLEADAAGRRAQAAEVEQHLSRVMEAIVASQRLPNQMAYAWVLRESLERYDEAIKLTAEQIKIYENQVEAIHQRGIHRTNSYHYRFKTERDSIRDRFTHIFTDLSPAFVGMECDIMLPEDLESNPYFEREETPPTFPTECLFNPKNNGPFFSAHEQNIAAYRKALAQLGRLRQEHAQRLEEMRGRIAAEIRFNGEG